MQLEVEIYISISYLATHRRVSRHKAQANAQATIFHKKGTGEGTGEDYNLSSISVHAASPSQIGSSFKPRVASDSIWLPS